MKSIDALPKTTFSGRRFTRKQLAQVQETVVAFKNLSRKELALTLCEHLDWRTPKGTLKEQSCLKMLVALEAHGVISLPAKRVTKTPVHRVPTFEQDPANGAVEGSLADLGPISLRLVKTPEERERWKAYLESYHYLGYKQPFGAHLGYFIVSEARQQELGCFVFSASAAWALAPRDQWIGWEEKHRRKLLSHILSNDRFLLFPWVQVPHLASHALSLATSRIAADWLQLHGYRPVLIETFVDPSRFSGTCYRAANWQCLGQTQGRGRDDPHHLYPETKKDIYVYALTPNWRQCLTQGHRKAELKKRYRNDLASSRTRSVGEAFVALWQNVIEIIRRVATEYDQKWQVRRRVIDSLLLMLLICRLVASKNSKSYGTTIDELWDSYDQLQLTPPQKSSIAPSSFCAARKKLDESIFQQANTAILQAYRPFMDDWTWHGHRLFAVDGTKIVLPPSLRNEGYQSTKESLHYPVGLLSCLYELRPRLPVDFDLVAHLNERKCARKHLAVLNCKDVVVYDKGYFSYLMLHRHHQSGIHAIFRLQKSNCSAINEFFASDDTDRLVTIVPSSTTRSKIRKTHPRFDFVPLPVRLLKYEISGNLFCLATTLVEPPHRYSLEDFKEVYYSRWGIEELFKVSKRVFIVEDFHAKTERGVKQELFAHFMLITMNRLFANHADDQLNAEHDSSEPPQLPLSDQPRPRTLQTNFKNCVEVVQRNFEGLLLQFTGKMAAVIQRAFDAIVRQCYKLRPGRSYPRCSHRTDPRWQPSRSGAQRRNKALPQATTT